MAGDCTSNKVSPDPKLRRSHTDLQRGTLIEQMYITHFRSLLGFEELERIDALTREAENWVPYGLALPGDPGIDNSAAMQHWMKTLRLQHTITNLEGQKPYLYLSPYPDTSR